MAVQGDDWPGVPAVLDDDSTYDSPVLDSSLATTQAGEPVGTRSYWWTFTPTDTDVLTIDLDDTVPVGWAPTVDPDTDEESDPPAVTAQVAVYTGTSVDTLVEVAAGVGELTTLLQAGVTYYVRASLPDGDPDVLYQLSIGPSTSADQYVMDLDVLSGRLLFSPTAVTVVVEGGYPNDDVEFRIDGIACDQNTLDDAGSLDATSVYVPDGVMKGEHVISVHSMSSDLAGENVFTLRRDPPLSPQIVGLDAPPVDIPAANTATGVRRWVLQDLMPGGQGSWVMPRNPTSMSSPEYQRTLSQSHTTAVDQGQFHMSVAGRAVVQWTFTGYLATQEEQLQLEAFYGLKRRFYVIDHLSRAWIVTFTRIEIIPRLRQADDDGSWNDWAANYTVTALIYDQESRRPT